MNFIPDDSKHEAIDVPYFDDVSGDGGWQGHGTTKSFETLKTEVMSSIGRLGGLVNSFIRGQYLLHEKSRDGFQIRYCIEHKNGDLMYGRIDIAALPVKQNPRMMRTLEARRDSSLKMALYMLRTALDGQWFLQQLCPGYFSLMPWMLGTGEKTMTQLWAEKAFLGHLLPEHDSKFTND